MTYPNRPTCGLDEVTILPVCVDLRGYAPAPGVGVAAVARRRVQGNGREEGLQMADKQQVDYLIMNGEVYTGDRDSP
ncbi:MULTISPECIES: hypothetical protein, partial [unclassified Sinorhizobium]|uniref:hypothetical protein n=1 Tax=unclassified Sinorhizobium TaxID=2613772 RepID=UPI0024C457BE